MSGTADASKL